MEDAQIFVVTGIDFTILLVITRAESVGFHISQKNAYTLY